MVKEILLFKLNVKGIPLVPPGSFSGGEPKIKGNHNDKLKNIQVMSTDKALQDNRIDILYPIKN